VTLYAPDSDFFINLQRLRLAPEFAECGRLPIVVTDVVWDELVTGKNGYANAELDGVLKAVAGEPRVIEVESPEAQSFASIHQSPSTENRGEHSIIAVAIHDRTVIPVLLDKKGLHRAVEELRRLVLSMHGFLEVLMQSKTVPIALGMKIADAYRRKCSAPTPHWWG
jgi:hypothetical protein